tara:strand:- start:674 stop:1048 length:375 start_codon:yes stop_codon:yes gene_type:complete
MQMQKNILVSDGSATMWQLPPAGAMGGDWEKGKKMNDLQHFWNKFPDKLKRQLDFGRKVNGDYSVHKGGYRTLRDSGRFVKNHVPVNLRDSFIQEYITKDLDYFEFNFKQSKGYKSNKFDYMNR